MRRWCWRPCRHSAHNNQAARSYHQQKTEKATADAAAQTPAQIELLETHIRFEADGSSRKEVHARVRINTELGTRQFARLSFDYNRALETVEVPLARITHASGGTADILPSAVSDQANPAVADANVYEDIRRKTVRILGFSRPTLWSIASSPYRRLRCPRIFICFTLLQKTPSLREEKFELDIPAAREVQLKVNPWTPPTAETKSGDGADARIIRRWEYRWASADAKTLDSAKQSVSTEPDVALTTFTSWKQLSARLAEKFASADQISAEIIAKSVELTKGFSRA